ncbi:ABC transporter ATP-binding protein [Candidatus Uabimicrobium sp. HlEnr_7]|uniref:ABC transporter ATP-binding protein n=1 Tax=Candidatus Uabimicrobium helgolandensis TaxID=3095367 RepID=UPI003555D7E6
MMNIRIENLSFSYQNKPILKDISLKIERREMFVIVGANGSGKTTLLRCISGLKKIEKQKVYLGLKDLVSMSAREVAQYLSALEPQINIGFNYTVQQVVSMGRIAFTTTPQQDAKIVNTSMKKAHVEHFAQTSIFNLSSGERQRVWLAMALAQEPQVLILDEPTSYLDIKYQLQILNVMRSLTDQGITIIATIHDLCLAAQYATKIAMLKNGQIVGIGTPEDIITTEKIKDVFDVEVQIYQENNQIIGVVPKKSQST